MRGSYLSECHVRNQENSLLKLIHATSEVKKLLSLLRCLYYQGWSLQFLRGFRMLKHFTTCQTIDHICVAVVIFLVCGSVRENITQVLVGPSLSSTSQLLSFNAVFRLVRPEPLIFLPHHGRSSIATVPTLSVKLDCTKA
ncbi:unnamed protein product [Citrullus colocynthis]|uniref:Uncharacterized protein n=1 Tax=Citrullus colocynthis TaxID=252529 RepID=A0ABP0YB00_9ROSI